MPRLSRARMAANPTQGREAVVVGHLEDCWDEPDPMARKNCADLEHLQGAWTFVSGRRCAELLVCGNHFTLHFADGDIYMGSFVVDPWARPRAMDMRIDQGPEKHRGKGALCVYELEGDMLRWCTAGPGQSERPDGVHTETDKYSLSLVFRRKHRASH